MTQNQNDQTGRDNGKDSKDGKDGKDDKDSNRNRAAGGGEGTAASSSGEVDPRLLEILVCPVTRGDLRYDREAQELISDKARLAYPVRDGIPIMLPEEARPLDDPTS